MKELITTQDLSSFKKITLLIDKMREYLQPFDDGNGQLSISIIEQEYVYAQQPQNELTYKIGFTWRLIPVIGVWVMLENKEFDIHNLNFPINELGWRIKEYEGFVMIYREKAISQLLNSNLPISNALHELESDAVDIVANIILLNTSN